MIIRLQVQVDMDNPSIVISEKEDQPPQQNTNTPDIEPKSTIKSTLRKISFNPNPFKSTLTSFSQQIEKKQEVLLKSLYKKINDEEREQIRIKAHLEARDQLVQLKGKLRKNVNKENIESIMGEKKSTGQSLLSKVMKAPSECVSIDKKHHKRINMKMTLFNEAQTIDFGKAEYLQWYDLTHNNRTNSPIYTRVNYLLQKVDKQVDRRGSRAQLSPLRNSTTCDLFRQKARHYRKIQRKKTEESQFMKY